MRWEIRCTVPTHRAQLIENKRGSRQSFLLEPPIGPNRLKAALLFPRIRIIHARAEETLVRADLSALQPEPIAVPE